MKKIGLSALAGSLVAISANAAEISVSGSMELTYVDTGGDSGNEVTGNSFGANSGITFKGSGDVGFGTASMTRAINDTNTGWGSSFQTLDMGEIGTFSFDSTGGALVGLKANDDTLPTAYEEVWTGVSGSGVSGVGSTNVIGYKGTFEGVSISAGYTKGGTATGESTSSGPGSHGSIKGLYLSMSPIDGLTVGVGGSDNSTTSIVVNSTDTTELLASANYAMGPVAVGARMAEVNNGGVGKGANEIIGYSVAFNVNENFAISYGEQENKKIGVSSTAAVTEDVTGISAAYTMGAASVRMNHSESTNDGNVLSADDETTEISLALTF